MESVWLWVVIGVVVALGVVGARGKRGGAEARARIARERKNEEIARAVHDAFEPPKWWEWGKARDQAEHDGRMARARKNLESRPESASMDMYWALMHLTDSEQKRKAQRKRLVTMLSVLGGGLVVVLLLAPGGTAKAFGLFLVPALFVASGPAFYAIGMTDRVRAQGGVLTSILAFLIAVAMVGFPIVGLVLGISALGKW
jgi:hypothetical protein